MNQPEFIEVFVAVDFDLQTELNHRWNFRLNTEQHGVVEALGFDDFVWKVAEHFAQAEKDGLDRPGINLYQVDIFAISGLR